MSKPLLSFCPCSDLYYDKCSWVCSFLITSLLALLIALLRNSKSLFLLVQVDQFTRWRTKNSRSPPWQAKTGEDRRAGFSWAILPNKVRRNMEFFSTSVLISWCFNIVEIWWINSLFCWILSSLGQASNLLWIWLTIFLTLQGCSIDEI